MSEASLNERPFLPPVDPPPLPVELGIAADEAILDTIALDTTCEVAKVVGTDTTAEDAAPGKLNDEYWKNPPAATLEVTMRLTESLVDIEGAPLSPPAGGETVMVIHSVVVVVLVELQELASAAACTALTLWTAPTAGL